MRVLLVGSGGREHALAWKLSQSRGLETLYVLPGNAGMIDVATRVPGNPEDVDEIVARAQALAVDLVVVGPEVPLALGVVDALQAVGIPAFGPTQAAARLESSKTFAKEIMGACHVPTAAYESFTCLEAALNYVENCPIPVVIKADGLAAGKGVTVALTRDSARAALRDLLGHQRLGSAGQQVVIEEYLQGPELSVMAISDGETVVPLVAAQDHKAVADGNQGPNTGGMGAYSPVPFVTGGLLENIRQQVLCPVVEEMARRGTPFQGVLYAGLMMTADGPRVLEFNCRFGDPETQVVLPRMKSDLLPLLWGSALADGRLSSLANEIRWTSDTAVCVIVASPGYPGDYPKGLPIEGLDTIPSDVWVFHAGTDLQEGQWLTAGGRVLGVTALGSSSESARARVYQVLETLHFDQMHYRKDIGASAGTGSV